MGTLLLVGFIVLLILGTPIAFVLSGTSIFSMYFGSAAPVMQAQAQQMFVGMDVFALLAIPLFMVAGSLMGEGGISQRLIDFCDSLIGHWTGGLAYVAILACMIFAVMATLSIWDASFLPVFTQSTNSLISLVKRSPRGYSGV